MLLALKSENIREIARYSDIYIPTMDYDKVINKGKQSEEIMMRVKALKEQKDKSYEESKVSKAGNAVVKLVELGIGAPKAQATVKNVIETEGQDIDEGKLVVKAIQLLSVTSKDKKTKKIKKIPQNEDDLRFIVEQGRKQGESAYKALQDKGCIEKQTKDSLFHVG